MNKFTYIKLSHQEANQKIWNLLIDKYENLKSKNTLLGYLWFAPACIIIGLAAIFSWFAYLTLLFKDVRFTPHYLRTSIKYNNLTNEQAVEYLDLQKQQYISSLAFGNISNKEKNRIDACFELLYNDYKQPEASNQEIVINQLNDLKTTVEETHSDVQYISGYTHQAEQKEMELEEEREKRKQVQQENSKKAKKRENSKNPEHFESSLTDKQLELLVQCCNEIKVFKYPVAIEELNDILLCTHKSPLQTTNARLLSLLLLNLQKEDYIHSDWQSIAARYICFKSKLGNDLTRSNDFSTAASASGTVKAELEGIIHDYIQKMNENN